MKAEEIKLRWTDLVYQFSIKHDLEMDRWVDHENGIYRFTNGDHYDIEDIAYDLSFRVPVGKIERFHKEGVDNLLDQSTTFSAWLLTNMG